MSFTPGPKYKPYLSRFCVNLPDRTWPNKEITVAPVWCSVDLRDGNQALINPMSLNQKLRLFELLLNIGFKEIEIGFPSAAEVEYQFARRLIEHRLIPEDVVPQVLTQAREPLIRRTFESIEGARKVIVHLYNSTSEVQRRIVFKKDKKNIIQLAVDGAKLIKECVADSDVEVVLQYSPESFTGTELEFAREVCEAVLEEWQPSPEKKMIFNLPATVEMSTPNVYADQIEWFLRHTQGRESYILSLHTHNDRGTGVAATELGLMAGADRVEGTLCGNGERTGNVDIVTVALNLFSQGIDPQLDFRNVEEINAIVGECTEISTHPRHPYLGELVFTAFSGSHQDAINKGMKEQHQKELWEVPYIPLDPQDIGRHYDAIVRINSQSGKGGVAYVMKNEFGCDLPREMHPEFAIVVQRVAEQSGGEVPSSVLWKAFEQEYLHVKEPLEFIDFSEHGSVDEGDKKQINVSLIAKYNGERHQFTGQGNGPIDAAINALVNGGLPKVTVLSFYQYARTQGADADAATYIQLKREDGVARFGIGIDSNTSIASIRAVVSAYNRVMGA